MERQKVDLSITIASFNARQALDRCLACLHADQGSLEIEIIVVDNGSSDGSAEMVAAHWPRVRLMRNRRNRYLTVAQNQAIAESRGRYILVLNSDMEVPEGTLPVMIGYMDSHPQVGASSCVEILSGKSRVPMLFQTPGEAVLRRTLLRRFAAPRPGHFINSAHWSGQIEAEVISDAFLVARREALLGIGAFDERLSLYYTEDDLCLRLRTAGWKVHFVPHVSVVHSGGGSHSVATVNRLKILWINYHDTWRYFQKHFGQAAGLAVYSVFLGQYVLYDVPSFVKGRIRALAVRPASLPGRGV